MKKSIKEKNQILFLRMTYLRISIVLIQSVVVKDTWHRQASQSGFLPFYLDSSGIHSRQARSVSQKDNRIHSVSG